MIAMPDVHDKPVEQPLEAAPLIFIEKQGQKPTPAEDESIQRAVFATEMQRQQRIQCQECTGLFQQQAINRHDMEAQQAINQSS